MCRTSGFIAAWFLSVLPFFAAERYRAPILPFLMLLASLAVVEVVALVGKKTTKDEAGLSEQMGIRISKGELAELDALADAYPMMPKSAIVRAALVVGLAAIKRDPMLLLKGEKPKRR